MVHKIFKEPKYLVAFATILLFATLGLRPIWTMENRWASIVINMLATGDYVHPYLGQTEYYDKPLLSYWLIIPFAKLLGVNAWSLRLPNAIAGAVSLWAVHGLAKRFWGASAALWAAWILLTSLAFLFWARVASADMLNVAGIIGALWWYEQHKAHPHFRSYLIFALILVVTALCKGIVAIACVGLILVPDLCYQQQWKKHLNLHVLGALIVAGICYFLPFYLSVYMNEGAYQESGLVEVFRENLLRFFQPFDHKGKWYIYGYYFPLYFFPWILFFIPATYGIMRTWRTQPWPTRWMVLAVFLLLAFFMLSQSRRSYYILPIIPFAALVISSWVQHFSATWLKRSTAWCLCLLFLFYVIFIPVYYANTDVTRLDKDIKRIATATRPWDQWRMIVWDTKIADVMYSLPHGRVWLYKAEETAAIKQALQQQHQPTIYVMSTDMYVAHQADFSQSDVILPAKRITVSMIDPSMASTKTQGR